MAAWIEAVIAAHRALSRRRTRTERGFDEQGMEVHQPPK
ncbi:hypothetical protein GZL_02371 [Streptomyces sp. 769]|nr:hypothetical protein GZL_02371 [Streptomyces sp. 769]